MLRLGAIVLQMSRLIRSLKWFERIKLFSGVGGTEQLWSNLITANFSSNYAKLCWIMKLWLFWIKYFLATRNLLAAFEKYVMPAYFKLRSFQYQKLT